MQVRTKRGPKAVPGRGFNPKIKQRIEDKYGIFVNRLHKSH